MAQAKIGVYCCAAALLLTVLCIESSEAQQSSVSPKSSYYELVNVSDIDKQVIAATYKVRSKVNCGIKCSGLKAKSFYFVSNSSECHCNTEWADNGMLIVEQSIITYGKLTESSSTKIYSDCQDIYMAGYRITGTYTVYLGNETKDVFCDLSDGGWTVFQRRFDGSVDFNRSWAEYINGFGDLNGEFWLGLETVHQMTKAGSELLIHIAASPNSSMDQDTGFARYANFSIDDSSSGYVLNIGNFSGNIGDSLLYHNGSKFSTFDMDNDINAEHCSLLSGSAGWWFNACQRSNLNGQYFSTGYCSGIRWQLPWQCEPFGQADMMIRY